MLKFLFFDYREIETIRGFERRLEQPVKHRENPLLVSDRPWENGNFTLYGSIVKPERGPFQVWYSCIQKPFVLYLCYAESEDGIHWERPLFDICRHKGKKTNIVLAGEPHGAAVIYDAQDPDPERRYKLVAGVAPSHCISAFTSPDGIHWRPVRRFPVVGTNPDCPMGFLRLPDGRYAIYHRLYGLGRRVCRSESWDFKFWTSEPRMVLEPDAGDPTQVQFYGMGSAAYGSYEIGTLWLFHTDARETGLGKMDGYQEVELTYARSGYAWHRAAQGVPFIPHGRKGSWEQGNLQCASQPVFLDNEIRYYYAGTSAFHKTHWELAAQRAGLGMAVLRPDRFVGLRAGSPPGQLITVGCRLPSPGVLINACTAKDGWVQVDLLDPDCKPLSGLTNKGDGLITGDSTAHGVKWQDAGRAGKVAGEWVRLRVTAKNATLYSFSLPEPGETPVYHRFRAVKP